MVVGFARRAGGRRRWFSIVVQATFIGAMVTGAAGCGAPARDAVSVRFASYDEFLAATESRRAELQIAKYHSIATFPSGEVLTDGVRRFYPVTADERVLTVLPTDRDAGTTQRVIDVDGNQYTMTDGKEAAPGKPWTMKPSTSSGRRPTVPDPPRPAPSPTPTPTPTSAPAPGAWTPLDSPDLLEVIEGQAVEGEPVVGYRFDGALMVDPVTYFVDSQNRILQEEQDAGNARLVTTYSEFGVTADIRPPPSGQVA